MHHKRKTKYTTFLSIVLVIVMAICLLNVAVSCSDKGDTKMSGNKQTSPSHKSTTNTHEATLGTHQASPIPHEATLSTHEVTKNPKESEDSYRSQIIAIVNELMANRRFEEARDKLAEGLDMLPHDADLIDTRA